MKSSSPAGRFFLTFQPCNDESYNAFILSSDEQGATSKKGIIQIEFSSPR